MVRKHIKDMNLDNQTVLVRVDFNVPIEEGVITDDNRIRQALPTLNLLIEKNAKIVCFSHLGRVTSEADKAKLSMRMIAKKLSGHMNRPVTFISETRGEKLEKAIKALHKGDILMFENTRFEDVPGNKESNNDKALGQYWASLGDVFINDAFGTAHREHASNVGIATHIKTKAAGLLLDKEIEFIGGAISNPKRPFIAIMGGAKVSDKIGVIRNLIKLADKILIGGGMSYTFWEAKGYDMGESLVEKDKISLAKSLLEDAKDKIVLPIDYKIVKEFSNDVPVRVGRYDTIAADEMGLDVGPKTLEKYQKHLKDAKTVIWNGPVGVFEMSNFAQGTNHICEMLAALENTITIIGGGDTAAAVIKMGFEDTFTHISTGGGASLEYLEGKPLPGITCLTS